MKRRNFLKYLSSIPLIGIPAKALAKPDITMKNGSTITFTESSDDAFVGSPHSDEHLMYVDDPVPDDAVSLAEKRKDPYEDVADIFQDAYRGYWPNGHDMNAAWMKRKS